MKNRILTTATFALLLAAASGCGVGSQAWQDTHSADQIFQAGLDARNQIHSLHLVGSGTDDKGQAVKIDLLADGSGGAKGTVTTGGVTLSFVIAKAHVYAKGRQFWEKFAGTQAAQRLGDRWVDLTPAGTAVTSAFNEFSDMSSIRDCFLTGPHGTLTTKGTSTQDGYQTVEIDDHGDKPGTAPTRFYVATGSPHFMVKFVQTGNAKSGGPAKPAKCSNGTTADTTATGPGDVDITQINQVPPITAPAGAIDIRKAASGG